MRFALQQSSSPNSSKCHTSNNFLPAHFTALLINFAFLTQTFSFVESFQFMTQNNFRHNMHQEERLFRCENNERLVDPYYLTAKPSSSIRLWARAKKDYDYEYDDGDEYEDEEDDEEADDGYYEEYEDYYDDEENDMEEEEGYKQKCEWESFKGSDILLPSPPLQTNLKNVDPTKISPTGEIIPKAIIHFIGGTFVGALPPRVAYQSFLEGLAQYHGNIAIVATSIPISNESNQRKYKKYKNSRRYSRDDENLLSSLKIPSLISPFDHWEQVRIIRRNFNQSIRQVLYDEYQDRELVDSIPIIGIGHSLGGRLQILLHSHLEPSQDEDSIIDETKKSKKIKRRRSNRRDVIGNVLISFNNYNAPRSVPLLEEAKGLWKTSRGLSERLFQLIMGGDDFNDYDDDDFEDYLESKRRRQRPPRRTSKRSRTKQSSRYDDMYEDEKNDNDIFKGLQEMTSNDLFEFDPSPEKLWDIIGRSNFSPCKSVNGMNHDNEKDSVSNEKEEETLFSYTVPQNLLVQFDDDELDQCSELARRLVKASTVESSSNSVNDLKLDLKFARLKGNHLTPCTSPGDGNIFLSDKDSNEMKEVKQNNKNYQGRKKMRRHQEIKDLIGSISTYVDFLVQEEKNNLSNSYEVSSNEDEQ